MTMALLALDAAGRYVAAAYIVVVVLVVMYVAIMAAKLARIERTLQSFESDRGEPKR